MIKLSQFAGKKLKIPNGLTPRAYFEMEHAHLNKIGAKKGVGVGTNIEGLYEARLYLKDKEQLKKVLGALKFLGIPVVIESGLTRIVLYTDQEKEILAYYLKGRNVDCQGIWSGYREEIIPSN